MLRTRIALTIAATLTLAILGCKDAPTTGGDSAWGAHMIVNGTFGNSLTGTQDIVPGSVAPWNAGTGSPQISPGDGCGDRGFLQMWGNASVGESTVQQLATPIVKGHTYKITACVKFRDDNPENYTRHVKARFVAFDPPSSGSGRLEQNPPHASVIGSIKTSDTTWTTISTAEWTADANYSGFSINAENETPDDGTPYTVSWIRIDNVQLLEKGERAY